MVAVSVVKGWTRSHALGLGLLVGLLVVSNLAVRYLKRPGQMSVIEAQAMDMTTMKPPTGAVPVATEVVSRRPFSARVRYTGSVAPYTEQNVYPRVEGWLTRLHVYNGDRVRAGQVLAVLDSPDLQTRLSEASYGQAAAASEIPVAQANLARMRAELSAAQGEVKAVQREQESAAARLSAAERMVTQAEKELKSARASLEYQRAAFGRDEALLKRGAVSQQEFDQSKAQLVVAEAEVENKEARVEETRANVLGARGEVENKRAEVEVARERVNAAEAALVAASGEVKQKAAAARMAGAGRATAATFNRYREIRSPFDGVVTRRLIHPGVLVNPGMAILNIVQIERVRLQANVAEQDRGQIKVGAEVVAATFKQPERSYHARVTSVSPLADQTSRTSVVEAVVDNRDHYLVPGDFISLEIATSASAEVLTVPSRALTTTDGHDAVWVTRYTGPKGKLTYYCTMHPEVVSDKPGLCPKCNMKLEPKQIAAGKTAHQVNVTVGKTDGERTEILSGLKEGDEVIYAGHRYLREGDFVYPTAWGQTGPAKLPPPPGQMSKMSAPGHEGHQGRPSTSLGANEFERHREHSATPKVKAHGQQLYTCPMHPEFVTTDGAKLCPKCKMKLEPNKD